MMMMMVMIENFACFPFKCKWLCYLSFFFLLQMSIEDVHNKGSLSSSRTVHNNNVCVPTTPRFTSLRYRRRASGVHQASRDSCGRNARIFVSEENVGVWRLSHSGQWGFANETLNNHWRCRSSRLTASSTQKSIPPQNLIRGTGHFYLWDGGRKTQNTKWCRWWPGLQCYHYYTVNGEQSLKH